MTLEELLQKTLDKGYYDSYTLIIQHYGLLEGDCLERNYYTESPIFEKLLPSFKNYIVLIPFYKPIDIGRNLKNYRNLQTIVVTTMTDLLNQYSHKQLTSWLDWLDEEVRKEVLIRTL